jgi:hypothetical protein
MKTNSKLVFILYGVIVLLLLGGTYLLYKNAQFNKEFAQERSETQATVRRNQLQNDQQQLTFGMKTFAWAVRNSLLQNKSGEINEYFNTLVKDRGIKEMLLVGDDGKVMISTNKKNQGSAFTDRFPGYLLQREDVYFGDKMPYELSAPITAPNKRLGTLVMFYNPAPMLPDTLAGKTN